MSVTGLFHLRSLVIHLGFSVPSVHSSFTPEETRRGYEGDEEVRRDKARIDRGAVERRANRIRNETGARRTTDRRGI